MQSANTGNPRSTQITIGHSARLDDGSEIRITEFDPAQIGGLPDATRTDAVREALDNATGTRNQNGTLTSSQAGGVLAVVIQSAAEDDIMDATFKTLSDAAKRQLSGQQAGTPDLRASMA
jgi:hypothetical protein